MEPKSPISVTLPGVMLTQFSTNEPADGKDGNVAAAAAADVE
jgi:hypothetical protein